MIRTPCLLLTLLFVALTMSCSSVSTIYDYTPNQTGMLACKFASETTNARIPIQHEDLVYGDGTVQRRSQGHNGIAECYEKLEQKQSLVGGPVALLAMVQFWMRQNFFATSCSAAAQLKLFSYNANCQACWSEQNRNSVSVIQEAKNYVSA